MLSSSLQTQSQSGFLRQPPSDTASPASSGLLGAFPLLSSCRALSGCVTKERGLLGKSPFLSVTFSGWPQLTGLMPPEGLASQVITEIAHLRVFFSSLPSFLYTFLFLILNVPLKESPASSADLLVFFSPFPFSVCMHAKSFHSCPALCNPMDYSPPGSSVHGILQARILEWAAISFSRGSLQPRGPTRISCILHQEVGLPLAPLHLAITS